MKIRLMLLLAAVAGSCSKKVTITIPDEGNKLVMNLLMAKDSLITAQILMSKYIEIRNAPDPSGSIQTISNARVFLYENDVFKETMTMHKQGNYAYYLSTFGAKPGFKYFVRAELPDAPDIPAVEGADAIPLPVAVGEMSVKKISDNQREAKANVSFEIRGDPGIKNYYRVRIYEHLNHDDVGTDKSLLQLPIQSSDPSDVMFGKKERQEVFIDDQFLDGRRRRLSFIATSWLGFKNPVVIEVTTLTYASYNYLYSSMMAEEKNDNILSEKVIVFNNVLYGLGIVGGMSINRYPVEY
ncbi:DUF4249 domain-containing protein [Chitinophaga varians]|uniref:DUF4249 domain-containing protein n=1 Tax=Chitinophaga varians TaxID=2202339 RepID=A0A847S2Q6_9BACT|nr:DUF4249 domain-containing protein [Chitinophaga varians]NLR67368.1 DUF4249 domain-containing protein [Chitinophaga varians]